MCVKLSRRYSQSLLMSLSTLLTQSLSDTRFRINVSRVTVTPRSFLIRIPSTLITMSIILHCFVSNVFTILSALLFCLLSRFFSLCPLTLRLLWTLYQHQLLRFYDQEIHRLELKKTLHKKSKGNYLILSVYTNKLQVYERQVNRVT